MCTRQRKVCLQEEQVCAEWDESSTDEQSMCLNYVTSCASQIEVCAEWTSVCVGDRVKSCAEFVEIDDLNNCAQFIFSCNKQAILDKTCSSECVRRYEDYLRLSEVYLQLVEIKKQFDANTAGFHAMCNQAEKNRDNFVKILDAKFEEEMKKIINPKAISVDFQIKSFSGDRNEEASLITLENYNFIDDQEMMMELAYQLKLIWSDKFKFDQILIDNDVSEIAFNIFGKKNSEFNQEELQLSEE